MSWGKHAAAIAPDLWKLICIMKYDFQDKLAIVETYWKLHVEVQNENEATF